MNSKNRLYNFSYVTFFLKKFIYFQVTHFRRVHKIYVTGSDIPDPMEKFEQLVTDYTVKQTLLDNIHKLGYSLPTPIQMQAVPLMLHVSMSI